MEVEVKRMSAELEINQGTIEVSLEIAKRRANTLKQLIDAVLGGDLETATPLAQELKGLPRDKKVSGIDPRKYRIAGRK